MVRRNIKSLCAIGVFAILASQANAGPRAIWEIYPKLLCNYEDVQFCELDMHTCKSETGGAVFTIDFASGTIKNFSSTISMKIIAKYHSDGDDYAPDSVFSEARLYSFVRIDKSDSSLSVDTIDGLVQRSVAREAFSAHMICHPA